MSGTNAIGAKQAYIQTRTNIGIEALKSNIKAQKNIANIVEDSSRKVPVSAVRGSIIDIVV